jgi:hypothetical protein
MLILVHRRWRQAVLSEDKKLVPHSWFAQSIVLVRHKTGEIPYLLFGYRI